MPGELPPATPTAPAQLVGRAWHIARGARYAGVWNVTSAEPTDGYPGWVTIIADRGQWMVELTDCFATEDEARAAVRARRRPRRPRRPQPLYGDFAQLAALHGIATDGTGRRLRKAATDGASRRAG